MITGYVNGQSLRLSAPAVAASTVDYLEAQFIFRQRDWDGMSVIKAVFRSDAADTTYAVPLTDGCIRREDHLNLSAGIWSVHLVGSAYADGEIVKRITTAPDYINVMPCGDVDGEPLPSIPATDVERLEAALEQIRNSVGGGKTVADVSWVVTEDSGGRSAFFLRVTYTDETNNDIQIPTLDSQLRQIIHMGNQPPDWAQVRELWFNTDEKMLYICTGKQQPYDEPIFEPVVPESGEDTDDDALSPGNAVTTTPQNLTEEQKTQARNNIGAVGTDELTGAVDDALTAAEASGRFKGDPGYTPKKGLDYFDGTSVTVQSVTESDASGGVNVVVFSDGKRINVKNGKDGKDYVLTDADKTEIAEQAAGLVDAALLAIIGEVE